MSHPLRDDLDLFIIGGGINGVGVARDASGRGLRVALCERDDLGGATSSASSKLVHGGLRYLEHLEFRLVREALHEREVLLGIAPHIVRPMRFLMPHAPWLRPAWMIRAGLFLYDHLGKRVSLPPSRAVALDPAGFGAHLRPEFRRGYLYSDCWVDDARLVVLNARDAAARGALVWPRTRFLAAEPKPSGWRITLEDVASGERRELGARALVNAGGPWVNDVLACTTRASPRRQVRLVKGSHMVVARRYPEEHALILQNDDGRVVFVIPYEDDYSLIGTTDVVVDGEGDVTAMSDAEADYLCRAVNRYLAREVRPADCLWSYAGVRPLFDDGEAEPSKLTRDYALEPGGSETSPLLSVYGGKLTTYRRLAERVLQHLAPWLPPMGPAWTHAATLPGGDLPADGLAGVERDLALWCPALNASTRRHLARRHGSLCREVLAAPDGRALPGDHLGADLFTAEVDYMIAHEWARALDDVIWRRSKAGLHLDQAGRARVATYVEAHAGDARRVSVS